jgi:hypothetical protein
MKINQEIIERLITPITLILTYYNKESFKNLGITMPESDPQWKFSIENRS